MEILKVIVSGSFKEKALLTNAIGEFLEKENIEVKYTDNSIKSLVDDKYDDFVYELQSSNIEVIVEIESLKKANAIEDLQYFYNDLLKSTNETMSLVDLKEHLRKILSIE